MRINLNFFKPLFLFSFCVILRADCFSQKEVDYYRLSLKTFQQFKVVKENVDFGNIDLPLLQACCFHYSNKIRVENKLSVLKFNSLLFEVAQLHSIEMVRLNYLSHNSPIKINETIDKRLANKGVRYKGAFENIQDNYIQLSKIDYWNLAERIIKLWMESPRHRLNMLNPKVNYSGYGICFYNNPEFPNYIFFKATQILTN